jgi:hypothetical protein
MMKPNLLFGAALLTPTSLRCDPRPKRQRWILKQRGLNVSGKPMPPLTA